MVTRITVACFGMLTGVVAIILFVVGPPAHSRPCTHALLEMRLWRITCMSMFWRFWL